MHRLLFHEVGDVLNLIACRLNPLPPDLVVEFESTDHAGLQEALEFTQADQADDVLLLLLEQVFPFVHDVQDLGNFRFGMAAVLAFSGDRKGFL